MVSKGFLIETAQCLIANYLVGIILNLVYPSVALSFIFLIWNYWSKNQSTEVKNRYLLSFFLPVLTLALFCHCDHTINISHKEKLFSLPQVTVNQKV
jgi:hypothetical protein